MKKLKNQNGFTLIELIMVMIILGILSAVAIPRYLETIQKAEEAAELLWTAGIPASACMHFNDSGKTPQHEHRQFFQPHTHTITGDTPYLSYPFHVDGQHLPLGGPAPILGQHTQEILTERGKTAEEIIQLESTGVIGYWPAGIPNQN